MDPIFYSRRTSTKRSRGCAICCPESSLEKRVWTTPIGIQSDRFLNLLAYADTPLSLDHLQEELKAIEREMGDSHENHQQGHVIIDLDVAEYDGRTVKEVIWIKGVQQAQKQALSNIGKQAQTPNS